MPATATVPERLAATIRSCPTGLGGMSATSASANASGSASASSGLWRALEADRGERVAGETAAADRAPVVARIEDDIVGQLEQPAQARVQQPRLPARVAGDVQVGAADVADQQRVAAEHEPRLLAPRRRSATV